MVEHLTADQEVPSSIWVPPGYALFNIIFVSILCAELICFACCNKAMLKY